tara:strand:- start:157 stop:342 length:186 start_codon:yes stop_codon:yes gene_type:complete
MINLSPRIKHPNAWITLLASWKDLNFFRYIVEKSLIILFAGNIDRGRNLLLAHIDEINYKT